MKQSMQKHILVYLKGLAMGAADLVPGVSGGTIALITHIYERLIRAIDGVTVELVSQLFGTKRKEAWKALDGSFLAAPPFGSGDASAGRDAPRIADRSGRRAGPGEGAGRQTAPPDWGQGRDLDRDLGQGHGGSQSRCSVRQVDCCPPG